ncbi:prepilin-type N-terminal cleavage/methylation domain-containing protein [Marinobacter flavimaris]|uniref:Prepilin-type N-terminal cleavage/methylation domain-containing protein n=1 Tax=Marinobacter flavimaris TaxID=262076 RepID=A0A3D8GZ80_9GAMM|nr:PilW family protein [Marinobacter flavimaris]PPI78976.1 pilus assembly protein PilW [Marinobacter flavimaris]RDU39770.1 prepilin-type N-terminal cleavage/methylation domain-containing protein [Marinobacter flavimaris]
MRKTKGVTGLSKKPMRQKGLSLVELIIALALSATLILGVFTVYMDSNQTSRLATSLARIQESGRIATDIMARDMRMVGYQGCADPDDVALNVIAENPPTSDFFSTTLRGWEVDDANWASGTEFDGHSIESRALIGSDVLAVQRGESVEVEITGNMTADNANIQVGGSEVGLFSQNDIVLISDCEAADLFRISSQPTSNTWAHANNVNTDNRLSQAYTESARIMRFSATVYFVADTGRDDAQGNDIRALYRGTNNLLNQATPDFQVDEIVEGVESLQIEYGELLATNNIRYTTADNVGDMANVVAIRIGLLISDSDGARNSADTATYAMPGEQIVGTTGAGASAVTHPEDRRLRRAFVSTVMLRNRD